MKGKLLSERAAELHSAEEALKYKSGLVDREQRVWPPFLPSATRQHVKT